MVDEVEEEVDVIGMVEVADVGVEADMMTTADAVEADMEVEEEDMAVSRIYHCYCYFNLLL